MRSQSHLLREHRRTANNDTGADRALFVQQPHGTTTIAASLRVRGRFGAGDIVRVTVDTDTTSPTVYSYKVTANKTAAEVATALAAVIDAAAALVAVVDSRDSEVINVTAAGGAASVTLDAREVGTTRSTTASPAGGTNTVAANLLIKGTFYSGDTVSATVSTNTLTPTAFSYSVPSNKTAAEVATALAALIDANAKLVATVHTGNPQMIDILAAGGDTVCTITASSVS